MIKRQHKESEKMRHKLEEDISTYTYIASNIHVYNMYVMHMCIYLYIFKLYESIRLRWMTQ